MKPAASIIAISLLTLVMSVLSVFADSIETWDGRLFEGTIIAGIPDVLTLNDNGVSIGVRRKATLEMVFNDGSEIVGVTTITGQTYEDSLLSSLGTITIRTSSGETEIAPEKICRIRFPYTQSESPMYPNSIYLVDGRIFKGRLSATFPEKISIDVDGITSNVLTNSITTLSLGTPSIIETTERTYQGTIISSLPQTVELETKFGVVTIDRMDIASMMFSPKSATPAGRVGFGFGAKLIGSAPLLFATVRWIGMGVEGGVGFAEGVLLFEGHGKYIMPILDSILNLYIGAGRIGAMAGGIALSGIEVLGGIELSFQELLSLPATVFASAGWLVGAGQMWHFGLRWDF